MEVYRANLELCIGLSRTVCEPMSSTMRGRVCGGVGGSQVKKKRKWGDLLYWL